MKVAFTQRIYEELNGPLILAELLERQGHEVKFFLVERGWFEKLRAFAPQILALSVCTGDHHFMQDMALRAKAVLDPAPLVIMGGPHPTFFPEAIEHPAIDAICRGEGEIAFPQLLAKSDGKTLPVDVDNFWVKQNNSIYKNEIGPLVADLDTIPIPGRKILYDDYPFLKSFPFRKTIVSRGCPFDCSYCFNHAYKNMVKGKGPYLRRRSVSHVVEEVSYVQREFGCDYIDFNDDMFIMDKNWILEFAEEYKARLKIPFGCNIHVENLDEEIARALKNAGCRIAKFGLEIADEDFRRDVLNKTTKNKDIIRCARILRDHNILLETYNMLGLPNETLSMAIDTILLNQKIKPFFAYCSLAQPLPGTRMASMCAQKQGKSQNTQMDEFPVSWFDTSIVCAKNEGAKFANLQKFFALTVRFPWLEPFVKLLIRLPENVGFKVLYQAFYGWHMRAIIKTSWWRALRMYLKLRRQY